MLNTVKKSNIYYRFGKKIFTNLFGIHIYRMVNFKSIIVYDSETTGLPHLESNTTKITELAFMGCEIEHLKNINNLPRVLHKLVLLFNPMKMILPDSSEITGNLLFKYSMYLLLLNLKQVNLIPRFRK